VVAAQAKPISDTAAEGGIFMAWLLLLVTVPGPRLEPLNHLGTLSDELRSPARIAVAADGTVCVTDPFRNHIVRFDSSGNLLGTWPVSEGPIGIALHADGRIFVSLRDEAAVGIYIDDAGTFTRVGDLDGNGNPLVTFVRPTDMDIDDATGRIYVVDAEADEIYGFASDGSLVLKFGSRGEGNAQFMYPSTIAFDTANDRLIIGDHDNFRAQIFDTGGVFRRRFGFRMIYLPSGEQEGWMPRTQGLAVDATGHIYMTDALMSTVRVYAPDTTHLGKVVEYGSDPGDLRTPCDLALSPDGSCLYVVSTNTSSVEIYEAPAWGLGLSGAAGDASEPPGTNWSEFDPPPPLKPQQQGLAPVRKPLPGVGGPATPTERPDGSDPEFTRSDYEGPHMIEATIICGRCHGITGQPGGHVGLIEGQTALCLSCHSSGGQGLSMPIHERDLADPYATNPAAADARGISHAWGVPAVNTLADSIGPPVGSEMERYLDDDGNIKCATCHDPHSNDAGAPYLRVGNVGDAMCKTCHAPRNEGPAGLGTHAVGFVYPGGTGEYPEDGDLAPLLLKNDKVECQTCHAVHYGDSGGANEGDGDGMLLRIFNDQRLCQTCHTEHVGHSPAGDWQPTCKDCHDIHDPDNVNLSLIATSVYNQTLGEDRPVVFTARTGPNSFNDGDPAQDDGICQVCHTATNYHLYDGSGFAHHEGENCTICHPHGAGFMPTGGSCVDCHAVPQDNGDGVPAEGRRAVVGEFPVGDAHAHYGGELDNDACTVCHYMSAHMGGTVNLIDADTGALYSFVTPDQLATDPDTSDFCQSCHDADGATRLATPFDPFGNGSAAPDVASKFLGALQWNEWYGDEFCFGEEGTERGVNSHHDISDADQFFSGARIECLHCHSAHGSGASQPLVDPDDGLAPWSGGANAFCLTCHDGGNGPSDPGFPVLPLEVIGPAVPMRGLDSCDYTGAPWYVDYTWTHAAHGLDSKRGWYGYSGAPSYELACTDCHDPHGSYTDTNTDGNPYMIRDFVDGTMYVDDGVRTGHQWTGPPWDTFGVARDVVITIDGITVGWGSETGLCNVCHATWLNAYGWHDLCTGCQVCHGHGQAFGELDYVGQDDSTPCPLP
jgi:DNA-binding beta-propeller fold protein YncE